MELRLADEEKKESTGGLKLSGKENEIDSNHGVNSTNPWDFDLDSRPVRSTSVSTTMNAKEQISSTRDNNIVLVITQIILYLLFALEVIVVIWCCVENKADIYVNLVKKQWIFTVCSGFCLVDAILVNILYERRISLIIWAFLLPFVYPSRRSNHINGSGGIGTIICVAMLVCYFALFGTLFSAMTAYGNLIYIADDTTRNTVTGMLDQTGEDGKTLGSRLKQNMDIESAEIQTSGSSTGIVIVGSGKHYVDNAGNLIEMDVNSIPTQLLFVKNSKGTYQLSDVVLNSTRLGSQYREFYNNSVLYR